MAVSAISPAKAEVVTLLCFGGAMPQDTFTVDIDTARGTANWVDASWRNQFGSTVSAEVTDRYYTFGWPPKRGWLYRVDRRTGVYQVFIPSDGTWNSMSHFKCERAKDGKL
jgi:hypothetical protein